MMTEQKKGKTVAVIGAGPGLGNHIAARFAAQGYQVALVSRRKEKLEEYAEELEQKGFRAIGVCADAADSHSLRDALEKIRKHYGSIDVLVYNAACMSQEPVQKLTGKDMIDHFRIDVAGAMDCVRDVLPSMMEKGEGTILFTGGLLGVFPNASWKYACMSMDKAALRTLAQMLNQYLENSGVFAGIVNVMGNVGSNPEMDPAKVADAFWKLAQQKDSFEVNYPPTNG